MTQAIDLARWGLDRIDVATVGDRRLDDVIARLKGEKFVGMVLVAPQELPATGARRLPVLVFLGTHSTDPLPFPGSAVFAVTRVESGETSFGRAEPWKDPVPRQQMPPEPGEKAYFSHEQLAYDVGERVPELPWRAGEVIVRAIVLSKATNAARVKLSPAIDTTDPDVRKFLESARPHDERGPWPPPQPGQALPSYVRDAETPAPPQTQGLSIIVPRVARVNGEPVVTRGSFTLRLPRGTRVVPVTLLLTGPATPDPEVIRLRVPVADVFDAEHERPLTHGHFAVDLAGLEGMPRVAQDYSVWAFAGEHMTGPLPLTLVSDEMLPGATDFPD